MKDDAGDQDPRDNASLDGTSPVDSELLEGDHNGSPETEPAVDKAAIEASVGGKKPDDRESFKQNVYQALQDHFASLEETYPPVPDTEELNEFFSFDIPEDQEVVEWEWGTAPFALNAIVHEPEINEHNYHVIEPELDDFELYIRSELTRALRSNLMYSDLDPKADQKEIFDTQVRNAMREHAASAPAVSLWKILYYLRRDFVRYGKVDSLMHDTDIEDISCDGSEVPVYVYHRRYRDLRTNLAFGEERLSEYTMRLAQRAGKQLSDADPLMDASLPDGSRIQLTLGGEVTTRGSNFTIRKFAEVPFTPIDLINWGTFGSAQMAYVWLAIENNLSIAVVGGTGSGKTTALNAMSFFIPPKSKVVSIEDTPEIKLPQENWIQSVARRGTAGDRTGEVNTYHLLESSLRQRPEYIIVGEVRTEPEVAFTFFQAISTGHTAYTTFHADTVPGFLSRLENEPLSIPIQMITNLDLVAIQQQVQIGDQRVRRNRRITEIVPSNEDPDEIRMQDVFAWNPTTDDFERAKRSETLRQLEKEQGWDKDRTATEIARRKEVLDYLVENEITGYDTVAQIIQTFNRNQDLVLDKLRADQLDSVPVDQLGATNSSTS